MCSGRERLSLFSNLHSVQHFDVRVPVRTNVRVFGVVFFTEAAKIENFKANVKGKTV